MSTADESLDAFVRRLAGLKYEDAQVVLRELDPAFVRDVMERLVTELSHEDKKKLSKLAQRMEQERRPMDEESLWKFIFEECGLKIPRKAVCEGHCAPFDFMSDVYFERGNNDKLAVGNRGSGKTQIMGALHAVNARTKKKYTSCTVGAVEAQSIRAYNFFRQQITQDKWKRLVAGQITMQKTAFEHGGTVEIVTGTITGVNSPHPILAHFDEVELLRPGVFDEALNMAQSKDGYRAMNVLTSSWKKPKGFVSSLIDESGRAQREGQSPPYEIYRWCVWETTEPCPHDCNSCPFSNVVKGEWEDGKERSFEGACKKGSPEEGKGKLKFTDGFVSIEDAVSRFRKLPRRVWEAQQESKRPTSEGLIYDVFDEDVHCVERWDPRPELGPIEMGIDYGGTDPHAANFWQTLRNEFRLPGGKVLPQGASICFDEIHLKDVGNWEYGRQINEKIEFWKAEHPDFEVEAFYGDPAARAGREDFAVLGNMGYGQNIRVRFAGHTQIDTRIAVVYEEMSNGMVYVDKIRCPEFMNEIGGYEYKETTGKPIEVDNHHMDAMGYRFWNRHVFSRGPRSKGGGPATAKRKRAITVQDGERRWDPATLGTVPPYDGRVDEEQRSPRIGSIPRRRHDPF